MSIGIHLQQRHDPETADALGERDAFQKVKESSTVFKCCMHYYQTRILEALHAKQDE